MSAQQYLDFDIEIGQGDERTYPVAVLFSPGGQARGTLQWTLGEHELDHYLLGLENALLRSGTVQRRALSPQEQTVQEFGLRLFTMLFTANVRSCYDRSQLIAAQQNRALRVRLRILPPELASLPWEFLYDDRHGEYLCLSNDTPIVRYLELSQPLAPLATAAPLRVLGMVASPSNLERLHVEREKVTVAAALQPLVNSGLVELQWVDGETVEALSNALDDGPWHIFHFIGHGGFDANRDEGFVALCDADGDARRLGATALARLLGDYRSLRLVLLNACDGARASKRDIFSSTTATLLRRNRYLAAVLAMQHSISDHAAAQFANAFYRSIASGKAVDEAVSRARKALSIDRDGSVEWGTPVLWVRAGDGVLFDLAAQTEAAKEQQRKAEQERAEQEVQEQIEHEQAVYIEEKQRHLQLAKLTTQLVEQARAERAAQEQIEHEQAVYIEEKQRHLQLAKLTAEFEALTDDRLEDPFTLFFFDNIIIKMGEQILQLHSDQKVQLTLAQLYERRTIHTLNEDVGLFFKGNYSKEIAELTFAIDLNPQSANCFYLRGVCYYKQANYDRAIADYTRAIELRPNEANYYHQRGTSYFCKNDIDRAIEDETRAIELNPQMVNYYDRRGTSYHFKGDYDRAIADYTRAIELRPTHGNHYYLRGVLYKEQKNTVAARQDFQRALKLGHPHAKKELTWLSSFFGRLFS